MCTVGNDAFSWVGTLKAPMMFRSPCPTLGHLSPGDAYTLIMRLGKCRMGTLNETIYGCTLESFLLKAINIICHNIVL